MDDVSAHRRLYAALKGDLVGGRVDPGRRILPNPLADANRVSVTPVREALFRLVGERLAALHDDGGFAHVELGATGLADLHAWNGHHVLAALHLLSEGMTLSVLDSIGLPSRPARHVAVVDRVEALFVAIGRATGNSEFEMQIEAANDRLRRTRLVEDRLFSDTDRELRGMLRHDGFGVKNNVRRRIHAYHRRRVEHAGQLANLTALG